MTPGAKPRGVSVAISDCLYKEPTCPQPCRRGEVETALSPIRADGAAIKMAVPSFGDIVKAIEIIDWLWKNCFDDGNSAVARWKEFAHEIYGLREQLLTLDSQLSRRYELVTPDERNGLFSQVPQVIGNFLDILTKCSDLLIERRIVLIRNKKGFVANLRWTVEVQDVVAHYRRQICLHSHKIQLLLNPIDTHILTELLKGVREVVVRLRDQDSNHLAQSVELPIPAWLDSVFEENSRIGQPETFDGFSNVPLHDGCNALYHHFRVSLSTQVGSAAAQYCQLLVCQWIIRTLRSGQAFRQHVPGSPLSWFLSNIQESIGRIIFEPASDFQLLLLYERRPNLFLVWPEPGPEPEPTAAGLRDSTDEERIVSEVVLSPASGIKIAIYRDCIELGKFRVVPTANPNDLCNLANDFDTRRDRFAPLYTTRVDLQHEPPTIRISHDRIGSIPYVFGDVEEAWAFQRVFTGYRVVADWHAVSWFQQGRLRRKAPSQGVVQIWQWDPYPSQSHEQPAAISRRSSTTPSVASSGKANSLMEKQLLRLVTPENREPYWAIEDAPPPAIVLFQQQGDKYIFLRLELAKGTKLEPGSCQCHEDPECRISVIERPEKTIFTMDRLAVAAREVKDWNLGLLAGLDYRPMNRGKLKQDKCQYLMLQFREAVQRRTFGDELEAAMEEYRKTQEAVEILRLRIERQGGRPISKKTQGLAYDNMSLESVS